MRLRVLHENYGYGKATGQCKLPDGFDGWCYKVFGIVDIGAGEPVPIADDGSYDYDGRHPLEFQEIYRATPGYVFVFPHGNEPDAGMVFSHRTPSR